MKVWVVERGCYDEVVVDAVYVSLEAAMAAYPEVTFEPPDRYGRGWYGDPPQGYNDPENVADTTDWPIEIREYEVQGSINS